MIADYNIELLQEKTLHKPKHNRQHNLSFSDSVIWKSVHSTLFTFILNKIFVLML